MNSIKRFSILGIVAIGSLAIAQSASARFVIFVSGNDSATLQRVRTISPTAFATKINAQPAIQAGAFNSETKADSLAISLQQSGLTAQKYFSASGGKEINAPAPFAETSNLLTTSLPNPQQVVIQQSPTSQPINFQQDSQPIVVNSVPQQTIAYTNNQCVQPVPVNVQSSCAQPQYQQIATNTVVPQVQTQQVLVPRWQQVMVPETRQIVTQTVVPQTQIVQTGCVQAGCTQAGYVQTGYVQPQTGFIASSSPATVPINYDSPFGTGNFSSVAAQPVSSGTSNEQLLPQATQNPNYRYIAAVPAKADNQFLLSRVRQYVPNAFFANSGRGIYIHAGAYQNRDSAESVSRYLRSQGVDSRVLYF